MNGTDAARSGPSVAPGPEAGPVVDSPAGAGGTRRGRWILVAIIAVCVAPVVASYLSYYVIQPGGRTNYGDLIEPQQAVGETAGRSLDGAPATLGQWRGRWLMVSFGRDRCDDACAQRLYLTRQVRLTTGKDRERVERLLLLSGTGAPAADLIDAHPGLHTLRIDAANPARGWPAQPGATVEDHIYLVDPLGNLMMRFPVDADPNRMKKDLGKLLKASRVG